MSRFTMDDEFDGVNYHDVYTDTRSGEKYGIAYEGNTLDLLNAQAETIEVLREWIRKVCPQEIEHCKFWSEASDDPAFEWTEEEKSRNDECKRFLAAMEGM